jgi:hypothetical protein
LPALWPLLLVVTACGAVVTYLRCPGCIERDRVNATCEWKGDTAFPTDPQNASHQSHLVADAQLAEELAVRYADASFNRGPRRDRRFSVEHVAMGKGRVRSECLSRMFQAIETSHAVTSEQVDIARGQRNRTFDLAAGLLFLPLYSLGAAIACHRLHRRFLSDERYVRLAATGLSSVVVSSLGLQGLRLWLGVWEVVRVGNGHMGSIRAASYTRWPLHELEAQFVASMVLFWLIALVVSDDEHAAVADGPQGILLRPY